MNKDIKEKWIAALESGEYAQTQGALHRLEPGPDDEPVGFCCLGVLCDLAAQEGIIEPVLHSASILPGRVWYGHSASYLPSAVADWAGMKDALGLINGGDSLSLRNDNGVPFNEIADLIREHM